MKKLQILSCIRRVWLAALLPTLAATAWGANTTQTVEQVSGTVTLSEDVDYVITAEDPFTDDAILDITNTENAVVILKSVKPSEATAHLKHLRINGATAVKNNNCMVKIYAEGCIILPHGSSVKPLKVYTEKDQAGESAEFGVSTRVDLDNHAMNNKIQSFTLMRGYMAWFATRSGSLDPGYNRVFIADKENLEVNLPDILSNTISALRVSQWNDTSKKGYCSWTAAPNELLNTTWHYNWDAGINPSDDREYVTQQHHRDKSSGYWWPSFTEVGNNGTSANVVTYNEPDNTGDDREHPATVQQVLEIWPQLMATGRRIGSPAVAGNYSWLYEFMDSIDARGWRCDFVVMHCYWYSDWSSWNSQLSGVKNRTGRPIWITEMNYGANWTGWPGSNTEGNAANYAIHKQHFAPIIDGLEATSWLERYCVYNAVQPCRYVIDDNGNLTPSGEYYANKVSGIAYNSTYNVVPKLPKMKDPTDLTVEYDKAKRHATLKWKEYNGEYNRYMRVERTTDGGNTWEAYATITPEEGEAEYTFVDSVALNGYSYRVTVSDAAGKNRVTRTVSAVIDNVEAGDAMQVNGVVRYAGGNRFVNGDFDHGVMGWTNGEGNPLTQDCFTVHPIGGSDGGSYLQAWKDEAYGKPGTLKTVVDVVPGCEHYVSATLISTTYFNRIVLTETGEKEDSTTKALFSTSALWVPQAKTFNAGTYSKAMLSFRSMKGTTRLDKVVLCPLFETRAEAVADGVEMAKKKAAALVEYYQNNYGDLCAELAATVAATTGTDDGALTALEAAVKAAEQGFKDKYSLDSLVQMAEAVLPLEMPGHESLAACVENARAVKSAEACAETLEALRLAVEEYLPWTYAEGYLKSASFDDGVILGWETICGTYTGGDQRKNTMAGKGCWNAWWSGLSAEVGEAQTMEIRQSVTGLPHGLYALECKAATQHLCLSDQHGYLVQGEDTLVTPTLTYDRLDIPEAEEAAMWETLATAPVYVAEGGGLTVGFQSSKKGATDNAWKRFEDLTSTGDLREGWWCATDFTLRYCPIYRTTANAEGWGVICLPYAFTTQAGVRLYKVVGLTADYTALCLEEVSLAEAGVPHVFYSTETEVTFFETGEPVDRATTTDENFRGNFDVSSRVPNKAYYLEGGKWVRVMTSTSSERPYMQDFGGIFRTIVGTTIQTSWAGATMPIEGAVEEMADGIDEVLADWAQTSDGIYTLDGRRVNESETLSGGVYIHVKRGKAQKMVK